MSEPIVIDLTAERPQKRRKIDRVQIVLGAMRRFWTEYDLSVDVLRVLEGEAGSSQGRRSIDARQVQIVFDIDVNAHVRAAGERADDETLELIARSFLETIRGVLAEESASYTEMELRLRALLRPQIPVVQHNNNSPLARVEHVHPHEHYEKGLTATSAEEPFSQNIYLKNAALGWSLRQTAKFHVRNMPNTLVVFHGTTSDCEAGLCRLLIERDGTIRSSIQALGPGFYVTTSFDEALSYSCARLRERRSSMQVAVLEILIENTDLIQCVAAPAAGSAIPDTATFVQNHKRGYYNQICVHNGVLGRNMRIVAIHRFTRGRFWVRDAPSGTMGTQGPRTVMCR